MPGMRRTPHLEPTSAADGQAKAGPRQQREKCKGYAVGLFHLFFIDLRVRALVCRAQGNLSRRGMPTAQARPYVKWSLTYCF